MAEKKNTRKRSGLFYARLATIDAGLTVMSAAEVSGSPKSAAVADCHQLAQLASAALLERYLIDS